MRRDRLLALTILGMCALALVSDAHSQERRAKDRLLWEFGEHRSCEYDRKPERTWIKTHNIFLERMSDSEVTVTIINKESLGWYFITAYNPWECGYVEYSDGTDNFPRGWTTASGTICHRADWEDRLTDPTTCAVDPSLHSIWGNAFFYIEEFDRVFVAEDTGSGVKGKHLDLFYDEDISGFPTGYYEVYAVEYEEVTIILGG